MVWVGSWVSLVLLAWYFWLLVGCEWFSVCDALMFGSGYSLLDLVWYCCQFVSGGLWALVSQWFQVDSWYWCIANITFFAHCPPFHLTFGCIWPIHQYVLQIFILPSDHSKFAVTVFCFVALWYFCSYYGNWMYLLLTAWSRCCFVLFLWLLDHLSGFFIFVIIACRASSLVLIASWWWYCT